MPTKIFSVLEKFFKVNPIKSAIAVVPILVAVTGTVQEHLGILPKNSIYTYNNKK